MKGYFKFLTVILFLFAVASIVLFCIPSVGQASHFFWAMIFSTILGLIALYLGKE